MTGYISELDYYGDAANEFVEIAVTAGTDVSGYAIHVYEGNGKWFTSHGIGTYQATIDGKDIYVLDSNDTDFRSTKDPRGNFYPDDGLALTDGSGEVLQFVSYEGKTVRAKRGPAAGQKSTEIGSIASKNDTLQSDDGGATCYSQGHRTRDRSPPASRAVR